MKKLIATLLTIAMLLGLAASAVSLAEPATAATPEAPTVYTHDGRVTLIDGACVDTPVSSMEDAAAVVEAVLEDLGGDARTMLEPWRTLTDAYGNQYYVFQQMYDNTTVLGGAVKVVTDAGGGMIGLTSSLVSDLPESEGGATITAEAAERLVLDHEAETRGQSLTVVDGLTKRMILPTILKIDIEDDADNGSRYVWVVYTDNPDSSLGRSSDLPYLAHYVTLAGEYLYALPTIMPGDEAGESGFDASYVFEFMESVDYTGYVDLSTGGEKELTVTVMRDKRTGMYYLGNLERRIVVADCYDFLYGGGRVVLESSRDNLEWDQVGLMSLYNYCRAYDYYKEIGWIGGDGEGTPILILNNYCDANHAPVDNAAYVGKYLGWQIFLASQANDFSQCLDVLGHEFTHCVTGSVMTYNAYMNDYGAINEAMSDIQGKTMQILSGDAENVTWEIGDAGKEPVRSMSEPHIYAQPEFTWDAYYQPNVKTPTILNDEGGVHTNSSLLNVLAWRLYEKGGMTPEEGRAFWFAVDCAMVPGTDYPQLRELLPWALKAAGLERLETELQRALDATRLGMNDLPDTFDADRALLTLNLPDTDVFNDEQWVMMLVSVNVDKLVENVQNIIFSVMTGDYSVLPPTVQDILNRENAQPEAADEAEEEAGLLQTFLDALLNGDAEEADTEALSEAGLEEVDAGADATADSDFEAELLEWYREHFKGVLYQGSTNAGQDGHTMRIVTIPGYSVPMLMHGVWDDENSKLNDVYLLAYIGNRWIDLGSLINEVSSTNGESGELSDAMNDRLAEFVGYLLDNIREIHGLDDALGLFFHHIDGGEGNALPATGLEDMRPQAIDIFGDMSEAESDAQPRMSRPKTDEAQEAA